MLFRSLFLDEIGDMPLEAQTRLLRVLQEGEYTTVGGRTPIKTNVRIIAATHRDLKQQIQQGVFREDLYYRLSVFELLVPPLRHRGPDIDLLIQHFFDHFSRIHGRPQLKLSDSAREKLLKYSWPGNVRQLRNVIDSAVVLAVDNEIKTSDISLHDTLVEPVLDTLNIEQWEQRLIREALKRTKGNIPDASELLGISRATMYRKLETYSIQREEYQ